MPKPKLAPIKFAGFDRAAPGFFHELAAEMNKPWFEANKQRYQDQWVAPMTALLGEVGAKLAKTYSPLKLQPPKLFRIYRDTRFAKDKAPYKTHIAGVLAFTGKASAMPMYVHIGVDEEFVGVGSYFFEDTQLAKWRKLVAADTTGKPLAALVAKLRKAGYSVGGHDDYKKVPKPYDADHPRAEFLKMRGLTGGFPAMPKGMLHQAKLVDWLVEHGKATAPLVTWLVKNVK
jgi:uncharacterized protein (TIGR02453 family)